MHARYRDQYPRIPACLFSCHLGTENDRQGRVAALAPNHMPGGRISQAASQFRPARDSTRIATVYSSVDAGILALLHPFSEFVDQVPFPRKSNQELHYAMGRPRMLLEVKHGECIESTALRPLRSSSQPPALSSTDLTVL